jgi:hypothetical protein
MKKDVLNKPHTQTTEPKDAKSRILSRIQEQLNRKEREEGMSYLRHDEYTRTSGYAKGVEPILD